MVRRAPNRGPVSFRETTFPSQPIRRASPHGRTSAPGVPPPGGLGGRRRRCRRGPPSVPRAVMSILVSSRRGASSPSDRGARARPGCPAARWIGREATSMPPRSHVCPECSYEHPCFFTEGDIVSLKEDLENEPAPWTGRVLDVGRDKEGRVYRILWGPPPANPTPGGARAAQP